MSTRRGRRAEAEEAAIKGLEVADGWVCALELATATARPWRSTARALFRLVASGRVRQIIKSWKSAQYRTRETRVYQLSETERFAREQWPEWAVPRVRQLPPPRRPPGLVKRKEQQG